MSSFSVWRAGVKLCEGHSPPNTVTQQAFGRFWGDSYKWALWNYSGDEPIVWKLLHSWFFSELLPASPKMSLSSWCPCSSLFYSQGTLVVFKFGPSISWALVQAQSKHTRSETYREWAWISGFTKASMDSWCMLKFGNLHGFKVLQSSRVGNLILSATV